MIFYWSAMDGHSKLEALEIFYYELEKCYCSISLFKLATSCSIIYDFELNGFVTYHSDKFFMCAKFWFIDITYAEVIANNSFSTGKPLSPRP